MDGKEIHWGLMGLPKDYSVIGSVPASVTRSLRIPHVCHFVLLNVPACVGTQEILDHVGGKYECFIRVK